MLTSLVGKYDIYFKVQAKRRSLHVNGYCDTELIFGVDCVSDTQQKSDICQVLKNLFSNFTA